MENIVNKLKKANKGDVVYDPNTRVKYEILEVDENDGIPLSKATSS